MSHACHRFWKCYKTITFCSLLTRCTIPCPCHAKRRFNVQKWREHGVFVHIDFEMCFGPQRRALFRHLNFQKRSQRGLFCTFRASHHNGGHFFDITTSKSGPNLVWFVHVDLEMCFVPQWRALFRHHNFQKSSERVIFHLSSGQLAPHPPL